MHITHVEDLISINESNKAKEFVDHKYIHYSTHPAYLAVSPMIRKIFVTTDG